MKCEGIDIVGTILSSCSRARVSPMRTARFKACKPTVDLGDRHKSPLLLSFTRANLRKIVTKVGLDGIIR